MPQQPIYEPRFTRRLDERCLDCEANDYLSNTGSPLKDAPTWLCSNCGGKGRVSLFTWEMVIEDLKRRKPDDKTKSLLERVNLPGARLALKAEFLDPYSIGKKG